MMPPNPNPIDIEYYEWLISQIKVGPQKEFLGLFEIMHNTEFTWFVPNDYNRVEEGRHLRQDFFRFVYKGRKGELSLDLVSVLEVTVALSRRVAFQTGEAAELWAWKLIKNVGLNKASDPLTDKKVEYIREVLDNLIWRNYEPNGQGGFFPLKQTLKDQTKVEIWYQMQEYVLELDGMG